MAATYSDTFPSTAEEFVNEDVIPTKLLTREATADWLGKMDTIYPSHLRSELQKFSNGLRNSCEKTKNLYQIQSNYNIEDGKTPNVKTNDFYYPTLLRSHELWTDIAFEMKKIFDVIANDDWGRVINLVNTEQLGGPNIQQLEEGRWFILLHCSNIDLKSRLESLIQNANNISDLIKD